MDEILKRKRNKELSKKDILEAAIKIFAEHGYEKATFKMIEAESGLSEALISRYFGSKRGLAIAITAKINDDFFETINVTEDRHTLHEEFHALGDILFETFCTYRLNLTALFAIAHYDKKFITDLTGYAKLLTPSPERIKKFQDSGNIPEGIDLESLYRSLMTTLQSLLNMLLLTTDQPEELVKQIIHFNIDMFLYGLQPTNKSLMNLKKAPEKK